MSGAIECGALLDLAARVFGEPRERLSLSTRRGEVSGWDSVNHLRLVMEAESRFGAGYALEDIPRLECLRDFIDRAGVSPQSAGPANLDAIDDGRDEKIDG